MRNVSAHMPTPTRVSSFWPKVDDYDVEEAALALGIMIFMPHVFSLDPLRL